MQGKHLICTSELGEWSKYRRQAHGWLGSVWILSLNWVFAWLCIDNLVNCAAFNQWYDGGVEDGWLLMVKMELSILSQFTSSISSTFLKTEEI
jgi:hypothetical protein